MLPVFFMFMDDADVVGNIRQRCQKHHILIPPFYPWRILILKANSAVCLQAFDNDSSFVTYYGSVIVSLGAKQEGMNK